jgi:rubrerythrin
LNELLQWHQKRLLEIWGHIDELEMLDKRLEKDWEHLKEAFDLFGGEFGEPGKFKVEIVKDRDDDEIEAVAQAVGAILDKIGRYERSF